MTIDGFWSILDATASFADVDDRIRAVISQLEGSDDADLASFRDRLQECLVRSCSPGVYAVGVLITGRSFDEANFESFRLLLMLKGRLTFDAVIANPDSIADVDFTQQEKELDFAADMLLYAAQFAFQERHGEDADLDELIPPAIFEDTFVTFEFTNSDTIREQFPRTWPLRRAMVPPKDTEPEGGH